MVDAPIRPAEDRFAFDPADLIEDPMTSAIKLYPAGPNQGTNPFVVTGIVYPSIGYSYAIATLPYSNAGSIVPAVAWSVINLGFIKITNAGGVGIDLTAGGSVSNVDTASIRGGYGVKIYAQAGGTVSNAGYIGGTGSSGAYQHSPGVGADIYAFSAASGTSQGTVSNAPGGTIVGANAGVSIATSAAVLSNAGYIGGTGLGSAGGVAYGVVLDGASSVDNSGRVVDSGTGGAAVMLEQGGVVENTHSNSSAPGLIRGGRYGVLTKGGPATIMNTGAINGTSVAGIDLQAGGTVTNARYGTVLGGRAGVLAFASATVLNSGGIYYNNAINTAGYGIAMYAGGTVVNTGYAATHQPAGTITGVKILNGPGSVTNGAASIIDTGRSGRQNFAINLAGSVSNYGLIAGGGGVRASDAIYGTTTVTASVTNEGTVNGRYYGVKMFGDLSHQGRNAGVVTTNGQAVFGNLGITTNLGAGLSFVTYGTILGSTGVLIEYATATATNLGAVKGNGSAANYPGTTRHNGYGIQIYFSDGTITNGSTADNTAYIHGARYGVSVLYGAATIANFGTIDGAVGLASYDGSVIVYPASFNTTVINAGTIATTQTASINGTIAFTGNAIQFGRGDNRLVEMPSAAILGHVIAAAGNSMLELASGSNAGTLSGVGGTIGDFAAISIDTGSNWYLDGSNVDSLTYSAASITNAGTLNVRPGGAFRLLGTQATGIIVRAGSTLTLPTSGDTLTATGSAVVVLNGAGATLANSGAVVGSGLFGIGVSALTSGLVINGIAGTASTSLIYGGSYGVAL